MLKNFLKKNIESQASYVEYGYGQVEPNHLSAQRTGQIYAQLPAAAGINVLEQGQFVKYDYAAEGVGEVNFTGAGEWMLVYNEIKLYRDVNGIQQADCEFAMLKDNYQARIYSPFGYGLGADGKTQSADTVWDRQSRYYNGVDAANHDNFSITTTYTDSTNETKVYPYDDVTAAPDMYEVHYNEDPFHIEGPYKEQKMPTGTSMIPRVFKTNVGDIFTTNTVNVAENATLVVGDVLVVGEKGILTTGDAVAASETFAGSGDMKWQVVKVYTMPDHQKGVKIMRIA